MGTGRQMMFVLALVLVTIVCQVEGSHFRGGTISWKWENGTQVQFQFRLGWRYGKGPGCKPNLIGQYVTGSSYDYWICQSGGCGANTLHNVNYICTGASLAEDWEQGKYHFRHAFPYNGPFTVGFSGGNWIALSNGRGNGKWNVPTTIDLRTRSDTGIPNSSPVSQSKPLYPVQLDCEIRIRLPVVDPDGDTIRCRWARGNECVSVCNSLPHADLDEETCILVFNTTSANNYISNGIYAVAVTIEDFPKQSITLDGNTTKSPSDALSTVPLQFLVQTIPHTSLCDAGPIFVSPTPKEKEVLTVKEGETILVDLYADNQNDTSAKANVITASGPIHLTQSPVVPSANHPNTFTTTLTWKTTNDDVGSHIVCAHVTNNKGKNGPQRCFVIKVASIDPGPRFVPPTPQEGEVLTVEEGETISVDLYADNQNYTSSKANIITASTPTNMIQSPVVLSENPNIFTTTLTWKTVHADISNHTVCARVSNDNGKLGYRRCFIIQVVPNDPGPRFIPPTPQEGEVLTIGEGETISVKFYADNQNYTIAKANTISASGPINMKLSPVIPSVYHPNTFTTSLTWKTTHANIGNHTVCAHVSNDKGKTGRQRCFIIQVIPNDPGPRFIPPTPQEGEVLSIGEGETISVKFYTDNQNYTSSEANIITASGPRNMALSSVIPRLNDPTTYTTTLNWKTTHADIGNHTVCAHVSNDNGKTGRQRCFVIQVIPNDPGPRFIPPTPQEGEVLSIGEGETISVKFYTDNQNYTSSEANIITASGPRNMALSSVIPRLNDPTTYTTTLNWKTTHADIGNHTVCAHVSNDNGKTGRQRCFVIEVVEIIEKSCPSPTMESPCENGGKWTAKKNKYSCVCKPGYTGVNCEVDSKDCVALITSYSRAP